MNFPIGRIIRGLAWIAFSPLAVLMALISKHGSDSECVAMVVLLGGWTIGGMASGVGTIVDAAWATRVQTVLKWLAFSFYFVAGVAIAIYSVILSNAPAVRVFGLGMGAAVACTGLPFLYFALRRRRVRDDRTTRGK